MAELDWLMAREHSRALRPAPDPNGTDYAHPGYSQPRCAVCGRFARKTPGGWRFSCVTGSDIDGWEHR